MLEVLRGIPNYLVSWPGQETSGTVAYADNPAYPALGPELLTNGDFADWPADDPDSWTVFGETGANSVTENPAGQCNIISDGGAVGVRQTILQNNTIYRVVVTCTVNSGGIKIGTVALDALKTISSSGTYDFNINTGSSGVNDTILQIARNGACNVSIDSITVQKIPTLVTNGGFVDWTADDPDGWAVAEVGDATSNVTQNPSGHCQIISTGVSTNIRQTMLEIGATYRVTIEVTDVTAGKLSIADSFSGAPLIDSVGTYEYEGEAANTTLVIKRGTGIGDNVTISNVIVQRVLLDSSQYPYDSLPTAGGGWWDVTNWTADNGATLTNPSDGILKVASPVASGQARSKLALTSGRTYRATGEFYAGAGGVGQVLNGSTIIASTSAPETWYTFDATFVENGTGQFHLRNGSASNYAQFRNVIMWEQNPLNGTYTNVTLDAAGEGAIARTVAYNGTTSYASVYSAGLNDIFPTAAGTIMLFVRDGGGGAGRLFNYTANVVSDDIYFQRISGTQYRIVYSASSDVQFYDMTATSTTDLIMLALTWDTVADECKFVLNGAVVDTQSTIGTFVGPLLATSAVIGAENNVPANPYLGDEAWITIFARALTASELLNLYNRSGVA
jgi:hypothetical protein